MNNPLVSVIITTHDRTPGMVLRAVESVLRQTYENIEIIVVDDSSDEFPLRNEVEQAVRDLSESITYIKRSADRGACAARNEGLSRASGVYIAFLDDDDEWLPEKIEEQLKGFSDNGVAMVYSDYVIIDEEWDEKYLSNGKHVSGKVFDHLLRRRDFGFTTSNPLIRKSCLDEVGDFDTDLQSLQDYDLWLRIARDHNVNCVNKPLLRYYNHSDDRISNDVNKRISGSERIIEKYSEYLQKDRIAWYQHHWLLAALYIRKGRRDKALKLWVACDRRFPGNVIMNIKLLLMIIFGYDSFVYKTYRTVKRYLRRTHL